MEQVEELEAPRYVTWDFERKLAIVYERRGECEKCGACCLGSIRIEANGRHPVRGGVVHSGVWYEIPPDERGRQFYRVKQVDHNGNTCNCLTDEKTCNARDNGKYAPICQDWPVSPDHQLIYPDCGYSFVEVNRWGLDEELESEPQDANTR